MKFQGCCAWTARRVLINKIVAESIQKYMPWEQQRHKGCHGLQMRKRDKTLNS